MANIGSCGDDTTNPFSTVNEQPVATTMTDSDLSRTAKKQHMQDLLQLVESPYSYLDGPMKQHLLDEISRLRSELNISETKTVPHSAPGTTGAPEATHTKRSDPSRNPFEESDDESENRPPSPTWTLLNQGTVADVPLSPRAEESAAILQQECPPEILASTQKAASSPHQQHTAIHTSADSSNTQNRAGKMLKQVNGIIGSWKLKGSQLAAVVLFIYFNS